MFEGYEIMIVALIAMGSLFLVAYLARFFPDNKENINGKQAHPTTK